MVNNVEYSHITVKRSSSRKTRQNRRTKLNRRTRLNKSRVSKKIQRVRKKKYSRRKKSKKIKRNKKIQLGGAAEGGNFLNRIGFELESCFVGESARVPSDSDELFQRKTMGCAAILGDDDSVNKFFGSKIDHFDMTMDESIKCDEPLCRMEMVLSEKFKYTYAQGGLVYADGQDITQQIIDEILLIASKADPCIEDSCGFHVHMSDTRPEYTLNSQEGKLFLLNILALWCGIEGITEGEQNTTFEPYVRDPPVDKSKKNYAAKLQKLNKENFETTYKLALNAKLTNKSLLEYLDLEYSKYKEDRDWPHVYHGLKYFGLNIYFLSVGDNRARSTLMESIRSNGVEKKKFLLAQMKKDKNYSLSDARKEYEVRLAKELWDKPLRIEFRGYKDLMDMVMSEIEPYEVSGESEKALLTMGVKRSSLHEKAKASIFYEKLTAYLDTINDFFERAKVYKPLP